MILYLSFVLSPITLGVIFRLMYNRPISPDLELKKKFLYIFGIFMFFMMAFRYKGVGSGDGFFYFNLWEQISRLSFSRFVYLARNTDMEKGFLTSIWIITRLFKDGQYLFVFSGAFISYSVCRYVYRNCDDVVIGLLVFTCLGLFNFMVQGVRQGIAMCICLYSIEYVKSRKFIPFLLCILVGILFHGSTIVFLPVYFIYGWEINLTRMTLAILCVVLAMFLMNSIVNIVNFFIQDTYSLDDTTEAVGGTLTMLIYGMIPVLSLVFAGENRSDLNYSFFFFLSVISFVVFVFRFTLVTIAERVSLYYAFSQIVALPAGIKQANKRTQLILSGVVVIALCVFGIHKCQTSILVPYYLYWQV